MVRFMVAVIIAIAGGFVAVELSPPRATADECGPGYYWSTSHQTCVERPDNSTSDVTAVCRDGSDSHSQSTRGTCSHHGGVAQWCPCAGLAASSASDAPLPAAAAARLVTDQVPSGAASTPRRQPLIASQTAPIRPLTRPLAVPPVGLEPTLGGF